MKSSLSWSGMMASTWKGSEDGADDVEEGTLSKSEAKRLLSSTDYDQRESFEKRKESGKKTFAKRSFREEVLLRCRRCSYPMKFFLVLFSAVAFICLGFFLIHKHSASNCKYSEYGWVATEYHAFGKVIVPKLGWSPSRGKCNRYVRTGSGFCLCNLTSIALPSDWGHGPVKCEDACRDHRIEGTPLPLCPESQARKRAHCRPSQDYEGYNEYTFEARELYRQFYKARGSSKRIGVTLPSMRTMTEDFVWDGKALSGENVHKIVLKMNEYKRNMPSRPEAMYKGKGIVIVGGDKAYATPFWIAIHAIRRSGSELPIEVWFPDKEAPDCERKDKLEKLGVTLRSFADLQDANMRKKGMKLYRFMYKIFALVFSSFEEVLLLDSDVVTVKRPDFLFDERDYLTHGAIFWMDFWNSSSAPDCQKILGPQTKLEFSHESGQMVVNKSKTWSGLMLALYMNSFPTFFYPLTVNYMGLGDKEILPMALLSLGQSYGLMTHGPDHAGHLSYLRPGVVGNTMVQPDAEGKPLFMHANIGKMDTNVPVDFEKYDRRWQMSLIHGKNITAVVNAEAGTDLEKWVHSLIVENHCTFNPHNTRHWEKRLGVGPFRDGMSITDHPNLNINLPCIRVLTSQGYSIYNTMDPASST